jgi:hypothetical protein
MMSDRLGTVMILAIIIIGLIYLARNGKINSEHLAPSHGDGPNIPYIRLYEGFNYQNLAYSYTPGNIDYTTPAGAIKGYLRLIIPVNLKSVDISLPKLGTQIDQIRRVEIWGMDQHDDNIASIESSFYNSYLEPEFAMKANPARYKHLIRVLPGDRVRKEIDEPVKKIFIVAIL